MTVDPYIRRARLLRVVDGDTITAVCDLGFGVYTDQPLRLLGIDTPEIFRGDAAERAAGQAAKSYAEAWFNSHQGCALPTPWPLLIRTEKADAFRRYLATVACPLGHDLGTDLLAAGHATVWAR